MFKLRRTANRKLAPSAPHANVASGQPSDGIAPPGMPEHRDLGPVDWKDRFAERIAANEIARAKAALAEEGRAPPWPYLTVDLPVGTWEVDEHFQLPR